MIDSLMPEELHQAANVLEQASTLAVKALIKYGKNHKNVEPDKLKSFLSFYNNQNPVIFNGSLSDLKWFWNNSQLLMQTIKDIPDEQLKKVVLKGFCDRAKEGILSFDTETGIFRITKQGVETINSQEFISFTFKHDADRYSQYAEQLNMRAEYSGDSVLAVTKTAPENAKAIQFLNNGNQVAVNTTVKETSEKAVQAAVATGGKAVGTTAAGVSTAGISFAAQAAYEIGMAAYKPIKRSIQ